MMTSEPLISDNIHSAAYQQRKRRFKIFDSHPKSQPEPQEEAMLADNYTITIKKQYTPAAKVPALHSGFVKIPKKVTLENQLYEEEAEMVSVNSGLDAYCTVGSEKFGQSDQLSKIKTEPSIFKKNDILHINEESVLFKSVSELKNSFTIQRDETDILAASVSQLQITVHQVVTESENTHNQLQQLEEFLTKMKNESHAHNQKIEELSRRMDQVELRRSLQQGKIEDTEEKEELKVFIEDKGYRVDVDEDDDQFVITQFLPAHVIAEFIALKRSRQHEQRNNKQQIQQEKQINEAVKHFHTCLNMNVTKYTKLLEFIAEEHPGKKTSDVQLNLIFRKGTVDLDTDWIGDYENLQYKESLLIVIRNSNNKCFGGFISNYLIQQQHRDDPNAFLFSLQDGCHKFKVKDQARNQAYYASKHYLISFGSDLMISSDCLQEESYCEWPGIYEGSKDKDKSMNWFAGDFSFMIEHIEVYEVTIK